MFKLGVDGELDLYAFPLDFPQGACYPKFFPIFAGTLILFLLPSLGWDSGICRVHALGHSYVFLKLQLTILLH